MCFHSLNKLCHRLIEYGNPLCTCNKKSSFFDYILSVYDHECNHLGADALVSLYL